MAVRYVVWILWGEVRFAGEMGGLWSEGERRRKVRSSGERNRCMDGAVWKRAAFIVYDSTLLTQVLVNSCCMICGTLYWYVTRRA
jgi:hypothetical protein